MQAIRSVASGSMTPAECQQALAAITRDSAPQGSLAYDPEYREYLRWLADQDGSRDRVPDAASGQASNS